MSKWTGWIKTADTGRIHKYKDIVDWTVEEGALFIRLIDHGNGCGIVYPLNQIKFFEWEEQEDVHGD